MEKLNEKWDILISMGVSEESLQLITTINGYNDTTLNDVLYARFGIRDFEELERKEYN